MPMPMPMPAPKVNSITWCRCQCQLLKSKPAPETNAITWCQCRPLLQSCPLDTLLLQQGSHSHCRHQGPWEQRDQSRNESAAQTTCLQQAVAAARIPQPLPICHACMPWTTSCMHAVNNVMHACREQCHACMPWTMSCMHAVNNVMHAVNNVMHACMPWTIPLQCCLSRSAGTYLKCCLKRKRMILWIADIHLWCYEARQRVILTSSTH